MRTFTFTAMGSRVFIALDSNDESVMHEAIKAQGWFEVWEQAFSRFRSNSELCQLNLHPGNTSKMSQPFCEVMSAALRAESLSGGLVTPAILNGLLSAGYTKDFEQLLKLPQNDFALTLLAPQEIAELEFNEAEGTLSLPFGTQIDLGGVAKGWAAHQTMLHLSQYAPVLVDAGGDISVSGKMADGSGWWVGVANPFDLDTNIAIFKTNGGGIATSGRDYRHWTFNHHPQHHIIDPRTMHPAETDILTATFITENVMDAETYAKTVLILGSDEGIAWLDQLENTGYLIVMQDGEVISNEEFKEKQWNPS